MTHKKQILIVEDNEATKQMSLETIVNEIRQNSQERMREIENELIYKYVELIEYIAKTEGIICAIESAHAVAHVMKIAKNYSKDDIIIVCISGRGDKDVAAIARYRGVDINE